MPYLIFALHLLALALAPGALRWVLAPMWGAAAALAFFKPDDRPATTNYIYFFLAGNAGLVFGYRIAALLVTGTPEPGATTLYGISVWLLGFAVMSCIGFYAYILRFLFWDRTTPFFGGRMRAREVVRQIKRQ
ncbi:MAG: hypothetical protein ACLFTI_09085 [Anaerolineales bacterium]